MGGRGSERNGKTSVGEGGGRCGNASNFYFSFGETWRERVGRGKGGGGGFFRGLYGGVVEGVGVCRRRGVGGGSWE